MKSNGLLRFMIGAGILAMTACTAPLPTPEVYFVPTQLPSRTSPPSPTATTAATPLPETPKPRVMRIGAGGYPDVFDPQKSAFVGELSILMLAYEGLTRLDEKGNVLPGAAERWEHSADGKEMTFHLRSGSKRSDGTLLDCSDFEYALRREVDPFTTGKQYTSIVYDIRGAKELDDYANSAEVTKLDKAKVNELFKNYGVECLDEHTLRITFNNPIGFWEYVAASWVTYPTDQRSVEQDPDAWWTHAEKHVGNGPFRIKEIKENQKIIFEANPNYWGGRPKLDRIEFFYNAQETILFHAFANGELDIVGVIPEQFKEIENSPTLKQAFVRYPSANTGMLAFNITRKPFDDKNVRTAFSQAIDREGWAQTVLKGAAKPYTRWIPPGVPGAKPDSPGVPQTDFQQAVRTLVDNGYAASDSTPDKPKIDCDKLGTIQLTYAGSPSNHSRFEFVAGNLARVLGCPITLDPVDETLYTALTKDLKTNPQLSRRGWIQDYPHPQNWLSVYWVCGGFAEKIGYCNPELDARLKQADSAMKFEDAIRHYQQAEEILIQDVPAVFTDNGENLFLVAPYLIGPREHPSSSDGLWTGGFGPILEYDVDLERVPSSYPSQ